MTKKRSPATSDVDKGWETGEEADGAPKKEPAADNGDGDEETGGAIDTADVTAAARSVQAAEKQRSRVTGHDDAKASAGAPAEELAYAETTGGRVPSLSAEEESSEYDDPTFVQAIPAAALEKARAAGRRPVSGKPPGPPPPPARKAQNEDEDDDDDEKIVLPGPPSEDGEQAESPAGDEGASVEGGSAATSEGAAAASDRAPERQDDAASPESYAPAFAPAQSHAARLYAQVQAMPRGPLLAMIAGLAIVFVVLLVWILK